MSLIPDEYLEAARQQAKSSLGTDANVEQMAQWTKFMLIAWPGSVSRGPDYLFDVQEVAERERRLTAILSYMVRRLSRGCIPDAECVADALSGRKPIPPCGYLNCPLNDQDHSH